MPAADLHVHSIYSNDGELGIEDLVGRCIKYNVSTLALTDHNSVGGIAACVKACARSGIDLIPGIEIDCSYAGTDLHLLGYNIDWRSKDFLELEKSLNKKHLDAFSEMIENLGKLGMHVEGNEVLEKANRKPPSPELIAEVLLSNPGGSSEQLEPYMKGGYRSDNPYLNFYLDFFAQGKPAHVKISYMDFKEAVDLVLGNGGIPIVAHPGFNYKGKEENASALLDMGAAGLEVFNNYHDRAQIDYFATLVQQKNALMTCGSDFHGKNKPSIEIGNYNFEEKYFPYVNDSILQLVR